VDRLDFLESGPKVAQVVRVPHSTRQFRFSDEQRQAVIAAYEAGATMASLAKHHGVNRATISRLLRKSGVATRKSRRIRQVEIDRAIQLYEGGLSLQKIGDQLGWDHKTIYRHLKIRGVAMRGPSDWKYK